MALSHKGRSLPGGVDAKNPDFIRYVIENYADDFRGYRVDILNMKDEPWQAVVGQDLQDYRRVAVQSGHGIGKTGFAAAAIHWFLATRPNPAIVATANTENQLRAKLWRELAKRNQDALNREWFDWAATTFAVKGSNTAFASAIPWSENNPEAFAGTHEEHVLGVFDEASAIAPMIWTTFSGAMSTAGARWLALGNPTRNEGMFYEVCNGKMKWRRDGDEKHGKWRSYTIGSPQSSMVDDGWVEEQKIILGAESDDFRVRVLGLPPRTAADQFIPGQLVYEAAGRDPQESERQPLILGVDVARQGGDRSVIIPRKGFVLRDRIRSVTYEPGAHLKNIARTVAEEVHYWREECGEEVKAIFIEGGGSIGWGVIEELWELGYEQCQDVNPGARSTDPERFVNMRCQMWGEMKEWFESNRAAVPNNEELLEDLLSVRKKADQAMRVRLETKDEMRKRGARSPDYADALALTFGAPVELLPAQRVDNYDRWRTMDAERETPLSWMAA